MASTQHFVVSLEETSFQGVYCSYCGKKVTPVRDPDTNGFEFRCSCEAAIQELDLLNKQKQIEQDLASFLYEKRNLTEIVTLQTRIDIYEQHVAKLKAILAHKTSTTDEPSDVEDIN